MNKVLNIEDTYNITSYNITNSEVTVDEFYNNIYITVDQQKVMKRFLLKDMILVVTIIGTEYIVVIM